jgi:glycosyltransferase involved in cell wall biosynthesis
MKVSVIVPVYNGEEYISGIIRDLHSQKENSAEFIIVDDGSTDKTSEVLKKLIINLNDERFLVLRKTNGGVSSARNMGIGSSRGKYIFFADADDRLSPNLLSNFVSTIENNKTDFEFFPFQRASIIENKIVKQKTKLDYSKVASKKILNKKDLLKLFFYYKLQGYPFGFISKKNLWSSKSFDESVSLGEDLLAILNIILFASKIKAHINNIQEYYYIIRQNSALNTVDLKKSEEFYYVLNKIQRNCNLDYQKKLVKNLFYGWYTDCYRLSMLEKNTYKSNFFKNEMKSNFFKTPMPFSSRLHRAMIMFNYKF